MVLGDSRLGSNLNVPSLYRRPSVRISNVRASKPSTVNESDSDVSAPLRGPPTSAVDKLSQVKTENDVRSITLDEQEDLEKIMALQYTINFDSVFASDYSSRTTTLSSIDLMKQEIESQYKDRSSETSLDSGEKLNKPKNNFTQLRRKKLVEDVWNKQHQYKKQYHELMEEKAAYWLDNAERQLANSDAEGALRSVAKYLFYRPDESRAYILKSVAYQQLKDLRMATMAIKMAQELGLTPEEQRLLESRLAQIEFKQAEKLKEEGEYLKAIERYRLASDIIENYHDCLVTIIEIHFKLKDVDMAMELLDEQIERQPDRLELRVLRARKLLDMNKLDICHDHLDQIAEIDHNNPELIKMKQELVDRGETHEINCIMMIASNHLKDALQQVELAIGARPKYVYLYLLRAKIYRRLKLWEYALDNLELINGNGDAEIEEQAQQLVICIYNDFGLDCIHEGFYKQAITLFTAALQHVKTERKIFLNRGDCYLRVGNLENALYDYEAALNNSMHESTCRLIRGRLSVVFHEFGTRVYQNGKYDEADRYFSKAIQYQVSPLYLIHRARVRIMLGNEYLAKTDAISAYEMDSENSDLLPVLARLFPNESIPAVEEYRNRYFPTDDRPVSVKRALPEINSSKSNKKKQEIISFGELRSALMARDIPRLPTITSSVRLSEKKGWKKFTTGIGF